MTHHVYCYLTNFLSTHEAPLGFCAIRELRRSSSTVFNQHVDSAGLQQARTTAHFLLSNSLRQKDKWTALSDGQVDVDNSPANLNSEYKNV